MLTAYTTVFCLLAILSGIWVAAAKHPITGAVGLVSMMLALSGLYGLLAGPFLGIVQITVYAGAIMMLIVFVIMVVGGAMDHERPKAGVMGLIGGIAALAFFGIVARLISLTSITPSDPGTGGTVEVIGARMFQFCESGAGWHIAFEITGLVLLVALVGAVAMAKQHLDTATQDGQDGDVDAIAAGEADHA